MPATNDFTNKIETDEMSTPQEVASINGAQSEPKQLLKLLPYRKTPDYCRGLFARKGAVYKFLSTTGNQYVPGKVTVKCAINDAPIDLPDSEITQLRTLLKQ